MLEKTYTYINNTLFDGELPAAYISLHSNLTYYGEFECDGLCLPENGEYFIALNSKLSCKKLFNVLVHEMIHIWQFENIGKWDHGKTFQAWCEVAYEIYYTKPAKKQAKNKHK